MNCINCKLHEDGFKTENDFRRFDNLLQQLIKNSKFIWLGGKKASRFFASRYQCLHCNAIWVLSIPDQSYRGGWREE